MRILGRWALAGKRVGRREGVSMMRRRLVSGGWRGWVPAVVPGPRDRGRGDVWLCGDVVLGRYVAAAGRCLVRQRGRRPSCPATGCRRLPASDTNGWLGRVAEPRRRGWNPALRGAATIAQLATPSSPKLVDRTFTGVIVWAVFCRVTKKRHVNDMYDQGIGYSISLAITGIAVGCARPAVVGNARGGLQR